MFYRKVASSDLDVAALTQGDRRIEGLGRAWFLPDMTAPNAIEVLFECGPDEARTIEERGEGEWLFEGVALADPGDVRHRVRVPVRFDKENASHTSPKMQLKLDWSGGSYQAEPDLG